MIRWLRHRRGIVATMLLAGIGLTVDRVIAINSGDDEVRAPAPGSMPESSPMVEPAVMPGNPQSAEDERISKSRTTDAAELRVDRLQARGDFAESSKAQVDLFASKSWRSPEQEASAIRTPPPPKPTAPAFPYVYIGGMTEDGVRTAFFTRNDRVLPVHVGETVDAAYRIDQLTDVQMIVTYLPLHEVVTLSLGSAR